LESPEEVEVRRADLGALLLLLPYMLAGLPLLDGGLKRGWGKLEEGAFGALT
jgi:hypothetical protein